MVNLSTDAAAAEGRDAPRRQDAPRSRADATRRWRLRFASIALAIILWQFAAVHRLNLGFVTFATMPSPTDVFAAALALLHSPKLLAHLASSLFRVLSGFLAAAVAGIGLGLAVARSKWAEDIFLAPLELIRPIPAVAWIPLSVLMFPSSELSMIFITITGAFFPILLNTIHGVEAVDQRLIASARSLGAGASAILREVVLPGALPSIITGLAIGMGTAWFCLVTAEMISGQFGIGYFTWEAYTLQNYPDIIVGMLIIGGLGMASSAIVRALGAWATPWHSINKPL